MAISFLALDALHLGPHPYQASTCLVTRTLVLIYNPT